MIFMRRLLAGREMTNTAERDCHAADAGVIVGQRAQGGPDELYEVRMVGEEGVLPERSERFSARRIYRKHFQKADSPTRTAPPVVAGE
jgi:hypothetical protein